MHCPTCGTALTYATFHTREQHCQEEPRAPSELAPDEEIRLLKVMLQVANRERDQYQTLAAIGTWHRECRPNREMAARELQKSQAIIDKLADTITELRRELATARNAGERRIASDAVLRG